MAGVVFKNATKVYPGPVEAVKNFNLMVNDREFIVLVGPSGCGKSTVLRMVAGLEEMTSGELYIDGLKINNVPPKDRNITMVFQNYALYPHMTVFDNMAFCLKLRKTPKPEIRRRVMESAEILGIADLLKRKPKALSGGERQRVALGRAMVREPRLFLMDEPLSNLDAKLRVQTRAEIINLHQKLQTTFIYVTHDQTEAMTMGNRIVVMRQGEIQQVGTPQDVYQEPANKFVAGFIGNPPMNFFPVFVEEESGFYRYLRLGSIKIDLPRDQAIMLKEKGYTGKSIIMGIRPEDFISNHLAEDALIQTTVNRLEMMGPETFLYFTIEGHEAVARFNPGYKVKAGDNLRLMINPGKIHLFDKETKKLIRV
jgi:multiple sugar transport system ATP-binding protein